MNLKTAAILLVSVLQVAGSGCSSLSNEIQTRAAADRLAIIELCNRYAHAMDHGDPEAWIATWTHDGSAETPWDGHQTYEEMAEHARREWSEPQTHRHILTNHVTSIERDYATHRCYAYLVTVAERKTEPRFVVEYHDKLRKVDGEWKFTHRRIVLQK